MGNTQLGGTVGDIESAPFIEAMRQFQFRVGHENFAVLHVSLIPVVGGEQKTKPTQATVRDLRSLGLFPDLVSFPHLALSSSASQEIRVGLTMVFYPFSNQIACRCVEELERATMDKVSMFCHVKPEQVMGVHNVNSTYHVPLLLREQGLVDYLTKRLELGSVDVGAKGRARGDNLLGRWKQLTSG